VEFAGVDRYVDTPVKRYSSGMTVRLGFAIAAHLEPEILVVDEVLAVGDADFQKKALGKMNSISMDSGRTVLFVSHNMASVKDLCKSALLLKNGIVEKSGNVEDIVNSYMDFSNEIKLLREWNINCSGPGNEDINMTKAHSFNRNHKFMNYYVANEDIGICFEYEIRRDISFFTHGINVYNSQGVHIFSSHDSNEYVHNGIISSGFYGTIVWIPGNLLQVGDYTISFAAMRYNPFTVLFHEKDLLRIQIIDSMINSSKHENCNRNFPGLIRPALKWEKRINKLRV
jgi:lipopolysaccharide transport system ATP-binding protein